MVVGPRVEGSKGLYTPRRMSKGMGGLQVAQAM